jgi:hypothetical protein
VKATARWMMKRETMTNVLDDIKQLPRKNPKGGGTRNTRADMDMAKAVREIAEEHRVTLNSVVSYAIRRLLADVKSAKKDAQA